MKKISILLILTLFVISAHAQRKGQVIKWFSIAAKGGVTNSFLLNTDILNDNNINPSFFNLGYTFGGRLTFSYGDNLGFGIEYEAFSLAQEYAIVAPTDSYTKDINIKASEIIPFFRYTGDRGGYFEIGPKFSTIKTVTETNSIDAAFSQTIEPEMYYEPKFKNIMIGFGTSAVKTERLEVNMGVRLAYAFSSITLDNYYVANDGVYPATFTIPTKATNPVSIQFLVELNYYFAFYGNASCGRGRLMFFQ
jgi:hypothetical protein